MDFCLFRKPKVFSNSPLTKENLRPIIVLTSMLVVISCADSEAPPISYSPDQNDGQGRVEAQQKVYTDSGLFETETDYYGVDFPPAGSLTVPLSDQETLTFSVTILSEEPDIPDYYCHHRPWALQIFERILSDYNCEQLNDLELRQTIEQAIIDGLESEFSEATLDKEKEIMQINFDVDSCVGSP